MTDFKAALGALSGAGVRFIIIGGAAATVHGSARLTQDLDVVYARDLENIRRLTAALAAFQPYLRGAPAGLPFRFDEATVTRGLNFTLTTTLGDLDLLGEIVGGGGFLALAPHAIRSDVSVSGPSEARRGQARRGASEGSRGPRRARVAAGAADRQVIRRAISARNPRSGASACQPFARPTLG